MNNKEVALNFIKENYADESTQCVLLSLLLNYERFKEQKQDATSEYIVLAYWSDGSVYNGVKDENLFLSQHPDAAIHTIMRLHDGVEFTLGDTLKNMNNNSRIEDFYKDHKGNKMWVSTNNKEGHGCSLSVATKQENSDYIKRPPLGLKPFKIHHEQRLAEINAAIYRYLDANLPIPSEWLAERQSTINFIK